MAIRVQTDQTLYLYEDEGDTIVPANGAWTIAWMFRFESDLNIGSLLAVMYGDFAATYYCGAYVGANGTSITLQGGNGSAGPSATGFELEVGRTYRFSLTHNNVAGTVTLANDGVPVLSISFSPAAGTSGFRSLHFAGYGGAPTGHIDATWARMRIWNAVLTPAELKAEFRSFTPVKTANLYNDWPMVAGSTRLDPASGTTQAIKIHPVPPTVVDGTDFGIEPSELIFRVQVDGSDTSLANSSVTVPVPTLSNGLSVPVQGDLEVIRVYCAVLTGGTPATIAAPAGWTRASPVGTPFTSAGGALSVRGHLFYREAPAVPAAATFSTGGVNHIFVWERAAYSNANSAALFGQVGFGSGSSGTAVLSSLTTARVRSLFTGLLTQGTAQLAAWPAGMTERLDNATSGTSMADFIQAAAGATGTRSVVLPSSTQYGWDFAEFYSQLPTLNASLAQTLGAVSLVATGTVTAAGRVGALSATLESMTAAGTGSVRVSGSAAPTLGAATLAAAGTVRVSGQASPALGAMSFVGAGSVPVAGSLVVTLGAVSLNAAGVVGSTPIIGVLAATLGPVAISAAGAVRPSGALATTLAGMTLSAAGGARVSGNAAITFGGMTLSAAGTLPGPGTITGNLVATLGSMSLNATGLARVSGAVVRTLDGISVASLGFVTVRGALAAVLEGMQLAASGGSVNVGSAAIELGGMTLSATAFVRTLSLEPSVYRSIVPVGNYTSIVPPGEYTSSVPAGVYTSQVPPGSYTSPVPVD